MCSRRIFISSIGYDAIKSNEVEPGDSGQLYDNTSRSHENIYAGYLQRSHGGSGNYPGKTGATRSMDEQALLKGRPHRLSEYQISGSGSRPADTRIFRKAALCACFSFEASTSCRSSEYATTSVFRFSSVARIASHRIQASKFCTRSGVRPYNLHVLPIPKSALSVKCKA